jgi:PASTA domain
VTTGLSHAQQKAVIKADTVTPDPKRDLKGADGMRFIFGVLVGYSMRGKEKSLLIILAASAFIVYIVIPTVVLSVALLALSLDVHHEQRSRPVLTKVPAIKGLSYEDAESKLRASNLNIRLLATRYDLPLQPGLIIDQVPKPGEEVVHNYSVGVTITKGDFQGYSP